MDEVLRIHLAGMGYTLNAQLGKDHLRYLYTTMMADPECYIGIALGQDRPTGVVSGSVDAGKFSAELMRGMPTARLLQTVLQMLIHPKLIWLWVQGSVIARPVLQDSKEVRAVLTAIVVDPQIQGRGIGRALVAAFEDFLRESGIRTYRLDTQITNQRAAEFYHKLGFVEVERRADSIVFLRDLPG